MCLEMTIELTEVDDCMLYVLFLDVVFAKDQRMTMVDHDFL
jgi:hypothetical protein